MSITVNIYYIGQNGNAQKFALEMISSGIVSKIRAREENLRYEYFLPFEENECVLLIDSWKDQSAIDEHHKSDIMTQIALLRKKYKLRMRVERYFLENEGN